MEHVVTKFELNKGYKRKAFIRINPIGIEQCVELFAVRWTVLVAMFKIKGIAQHFITSYTNNTNEKTDD